MSTEVIVLLVSGVLGDRQTTVDLAWLGDLDHDNPDQSRAFKITTQSLHMCIEEDIVNGEKTNESIQGVITAISANNTSPLSPNHTISSMCL
ncbi:hypothetical protein BJ875DRAFT_487229 [Amylocarpus encephaloides]|uniref:Uncharacterized protein n=1 Tax=Amylocarpus encephaloides TaxID=45428 RepID=A0A9P8C2M0_9HELO|nr:hypothetical protein BJ875DRAFT_487229 [Amylocarpus encephaloides]